MRRLQEHLLIVTLTAFITLIYSYNYITHPLTLNSVDFQSRWESELFSRVKEDLMNFERGELNKIETQEYKIVDTYKEPFDAFVEQMSRIRFHKELRQISEQERLNFTKEYYERKFYDTPTPVRDKWRDQIIKETLKIANHDRIKFENKSWIDINWQNFLMYENDSLDYELEIKLNELQKPTDNCLRNDSRYLVYYLHKDNGLGSELHCIQLAFTAAFITNRTLILSEDDEWHWADPSVCGSKTWSCYFEPLSTCANPIPGSRYISRKNINRFNTQNLGANDKDQVLIWESYWDPSFWYTLPQVYQHKGVFWWRSQLTHWMCKLNPWVHNWVTESIHQFELSNNITIQDMAAVHIRRGDKVYGSEFNNPEMGFISSYRIVHTLSEIHKRVNFSVVYVGTRDAEVVEEFFHISEKYELPFKFIFDMEQQLDEGFSTINLLTKKLNGTREILFDVYLMRKAKHFLGMMDSNFSRFVFELIARTNSEERIVDRVASLGDWLLNP